MEEPTSANEDNDSLQAAARSGQEEIMLKILGCWPALIYHRNMRGDTPLHIAAKAGHLGVVELLISFSQSLHRSQTSGSTENRVEEIPSVRNDESIIVIQKDSTTAFTYSHEPPQSSQSGSRGNIEIKAICKTRNHDGSTALHEALRNKQEDIALHLLDEDSEPVEFANVKDESPLYLAAKAGFVRVLHKILEVGNKPDTVGPNGRTPFHAAVFAKSKESIEVLYGSIAERINERDSYGKTALYYATQEDSLEIMRLLLELDVSSALIHDDEGLSPLLVAVKKGRSASVLAILNACPDSIKLSDNSDRNALHLAVRHNTLEKFKTLLSFPKIKALAIKGDQEGNTPLHLAIILKKYHHVEALLDFTMVKAKARNSAGRTALDLWPLDGDLSDEQRQIRVALVVASKLYSSWRPMTMFTGSEMVDEKLLGMIQDKDLSQTTNAMSVVAALIATITFAAVFQMPGGYKSDGSPLLIHKAALKAFVLTDTIAFCLSMVALCYLVVASTNDKVSSANVNGLLVSGALLIYALFSATIAFISGIYVVISAESRWMAILVSVICCTAVFCGSGFIPQISDLCKKINLRKRYVVLGNRVRDFLVKTHH